MGTGDPGGQDESLWLTAKAVEGLWPEIRPPYIGAVARAHAVRTAGLPAGGTGYDAADVERVAELIARGEADVLGWRRSDAPRTVVAPEDGRRVADRSGAMIVFIAILLVVLFLWALGSHHPAGGGCGVACGI